MLRMVAAGADRLPVTDVAANEHLEQQLLALRKCLVGGVAGHKATYLSRNLSVKEGTDRANPQYSM